MRQEEDKELRDFEIRQWFFILRNLYIREGKSEYDATEQAYEDIGIRFCLRKSSIRKAKNIVHTRRNSTALMFNVKSNLRHLKQTIQKLEKAIGEN